MMLQEVGQIQSEDLNLGKQGGGLCRRGGRRDVISGFWTSDAEHELLSQKFSTPSV